MIRLRSAGLLLLSAAAVVCAQDAPVTYTEHVAPILLNSCAPCHRPGEAGPFPLLTYTDAQRRGRMIAAVTASSYMPPWKAEPGFERYQHNRSLTAAQVATIQRWVAAGMPEGDPAKAPPTPQFIQGWQLGTPDLVVELPQAFPVPANSADIYRYFAIPLNLPEDKWLTAIELRPTARSVVHHVLYFADTTGAAVRAQQANRDGQPGFANMSFLASALTGGNTGVSQLGGWVPGATPQFQPWNLALPLRKGSDLVLQTHFHPTGKAENEKTVVGLYFAKQAPTRTLVQMQVPPLFGALWGINIPAGESSYLVRDTFTLPVDVEAVEISGHAHYLARDAKLTATLPDGTVRVLLWIKDWDIAWQDNYLFEQPVPLPAGTRLDAELVYDNSASSPRQPSNPPKAVRWGEQSTDEMGSLLLSMMPRRESDVAALQSALQRQLVEAAVDRLTRSTTRPVVVSSGIVDAAKSRFDRLTGGKIISLYGRNLGPANAALAVPDAEGRLPRELSNVKVTIGGIDAPLLLVSAGQINALVPYGVDGKPGAQVVVSNNFRASAPVAMPTAAAAPSIFTANQTGSGQAAALNGDLSPNSSSRPAPAGGIVVLYATGEGQTAPGGIDGLLAKGTTLPRPLQTVKAWIGGREAVVDYAGATPGLVAGLLQVNVRVPDGTPTGDVPIEIEVGGVKSQRGVTVAVR